MRITMLLVTMLLLPGCMIGPDYVRPRVKTPTSYQYAQDSQDQVDLRTWWHVFNDECLTDLIKRAACENYDLRIAVERIQQVAAAYRLQRTKLFPEVDGVIETNRRHFSANLTQFEFLTPSQRILDFLKFGFEVFWEVDLWGRVRRATRAAYAEYEAQVEDARGVYIMILSDVASAYIDLRTLAKKIQLRKERIDVDSKLLVLQKDRYDAGLDSNILVQQTDAELEASKSLLATLLILFAQTKNGLAVLLGQLPEEFEVCGTEKLGVPTANIELQAGIASDLLRRRPDIRQAERILAASTERIGEAIADLYPRFNLLASVSTEASNPRGWFSSGSLNWFVGSNARWPLMNFGRVTYNIEAKNSMQRQALLAYCQSIVRAFADVEDALVAHFTEKERVALLQKRLNAVTIERDFIYDRATAGLDNQSDYLLAQKTRIESEELLVDAQRAQSLALIAVYKALGGGWSECDEENDVPHSP